VGCYSQPLNDDRRGMIEETENRDKNGGKEKKIIFTLWVTQMRTCDTRVQSVNLLGKMYFSTALDREKEREYMDNLISRLGRIFLLFLDRLPLPGTWKGGPARNVNTYGHILTIGL